MKRPTVYKASIIAVLLLGWVYQASARPIDYNEISLLVRAREPESSIRRDVAERKLMHALTPEQEGKLKAQGASDSLIQALRNSNLVVSKEEASAFEAASEQHKAATMENSAMDRDHGKLYVFDVAIGHSINLSQWGGSDYEIAFYSYRCAGEDIIEPAMIDPIRTVSVVSRVIPTGGLSEDEVFADNGHTKDFYRRQRFNENDNDGHRFTPYDARRDMRDDRFNYSDTVAAQSYSASRTLAIDFSSPVTMEGVPYALYPVYGAGGVSLYYIAGSSSSVKVAVSTR